jgi:hypothetical protein
MLVNAGFTLLERNSMFHTLTLKQREELTPDEVALLSLSLTATSFVLEFTAHDDIFLGQFAHLYIYHSLHRHFSPKGLLYFGRFYPISASFQETANPPRLKVRLTCFPSPCERLSRSRTTMEAPSP